MLYSFSILYRIEWVVTEQSDAARCVGPAFSILYRIEWVVTYSGHLLAEGYTKAFSILYRIEWVVTTPPSGGNGSCWPFQYPVSDRMGCNL